MKDKSPSIRMLFEGKTPTTWQKKMPSPNGRAKALGC
jgi:hypothetical protein